MNINKLITLSLMLSIVFPPVVAQAAVPTEDFHASIINYTEDNSTAPVLEANAVFTSIGLGTLGNFTVNYQVLDVCKGNADVFNGSLTITNGQLKVKTGSPSSGKFVMKYDAATDTITARFTLRPATSCYSVAASAALPSQITWEGSATVRNHTIL